MPTSGRSKQDQQQTKGFLTTHVLDTAVGIPASGMSVTLYKADSAGNYHKIENFVTNSDGRVDTQILVADAFVSGRYRLIFAVAAYYRQQGTLLTEPAFLDLVPIDFGIADEHSHYHVPLLVSPYGYSTYRGS